MTEPASTSPCADRGIGVARPTPSAEGTWFRTSEGRRYGWELGFIVVAKLALLIVLWLVFIQPWPSPATPAASVVQHFYVPVTPAGSHD
jgi:hypothetical protein